MKEPTLRLSIAGRTHSLTYNFASMRKVQERFHSEGAIGLSIARRDFGYGDCTDFYHAMLRGCIPDAEFTAEEVYEALRDVGMVNAVAQINDFLGECIDAARPEVPEDGDDTGKETANQS